MNRRALLRSALGYPEPDQPVLEKQPLPELEAPLPPPDTGIAPYTGEWNRATAAHLLRRGMYGPTFAQIEEARQAGLQAVIDQLLTDLPTPEPPLNVNPLDPGVAVGETWVDTIMPRNDARALEERRLSSRSWMMGLIINEGVSIREKMTVFWMDHFVVEQFIVRDPTFMHKHIALMREYATGDFRELVKKVTISPAMLRYLNGNDNEKGAPNENYARELFELFTVGKGALAGEGDYTTFTELDVEQAAKALTGWKDQGYIKQRADIPTQGQFVANQHDTSTKQFSHRFNNARLNNGGENEYADLIDIILESPAVATFLAEKLYRYFVYYIITDDVRQQVIEPLAQVIRDNNYYIKPALEVLLKSEHFFDILSQGPMIKNPLDFVIGQVKQCEIDYPEDLEGRYQVWLKLYGESKKMQMELFDPPDVAGWKAYYQEPLFYRIWINSVTLPLRSRSAELLAKNGYRIGSIRVQVDVLTFVEKTSDASDPNVLIDELAELFYPQPLNQLQLDALKEVLLPGLPDFEWTIEYEEYKNNPSDVRLAASIEKKLRELFVSMVAMAEYHLS
jgi:uncharacterized protein (DUF1800 family)